MTSDLRSAALNADDITIELVAVPEWGNNKYGVRSLTINEQRQFITAVSTKVKDPDGDWVTEINRDKYAIQLLIRTVVDPDSDELVFEQADAEALWAKSGKAVSRLIGVATRLAGLDGKDQVDDMVDELKETADSDSASG